MTAQKTSRRDFLKAAAGTVGAGVVAASGLEAGIKTAAAATPAVRARSLEPSGVMWCLNFAPHVDANRRSAALFKKKFGSTITVQPQPWGYTNLIAAIAAGTQPDLVNTNGQLMTALMLQGALTPIGQSVYKHNNLFPTSKYFAGDALEPWTLEGRVYGVPYETDGAIGGNINVNIDAVNKAGLQKMYPPTNGKQNFESYDQLFALAKALQVTVNGKVKRWGITGEGWDLEDISAMMNTMGTPPFDAAHERFNWNTPVGIRAMQYHAEMPVKMGIEKEWNNGQAVIDEMLNGNVALSKANADSIRLGPGYGYNIQAAGVPYIDGHKPVTIGTGVGWGMVGPIRSQHPNLQLAYLQMAATYEGQYTFDLIYNGIPVPAWKSILLHDKSRFKPPFNKDSFYSLATQPWFIDSLANCRYIGRIGYTNRVTDAVVAACQAVRLKKMSAAQAMALVQTRSEAQYKQYKADLANLM